MATQPAKRTAKAVKFSSGSGGWHLELGHDPASQPVIFAPKTQPINIRLSLPNGDIRSCCFEQRVSLFFDISGDIRVRETLGESVNGKVDDNNTIAAQIRFPAGSYSLVSNTAAFNISDAEPKHVLEIKHRKDQVWPRPEMFTQNKGLARVNATLIPQMFSCHPEGKLGVGFPTCTFAKFVWTDPMKNAFLQKSLEPMRELLAASEEVTPLTVAHKFMQKQMDALEAEFEHKCKELDALKRSNCSATSYRDAAHKGSMMLDLSSREPGTWALEVGHILFLNNGTEFGDKAPTTGYQGATAWTAQVIRNNESSAVVKVDNRIDEEHKPWLDGRSFVRINVKVSKEEPMYRKHCNAIKNMDETVDLELRAKNSSYTGDKSKLRIEQSRLWVTGLQQNVADWEDHPFDLLGGALKFPLWLEDRLETSHKVAIQKLVEGKAGVAGMIGPPGTGKTTLMTCMAALALKQFEMSRNRIIMAGQSGFAVKALLEKCMENFARYGLKPERHILWVETSAGQKRRQEQGGSMGHLEALSLEVNMVKIADIPEHKVKYARWRELHQAEKDGKVLDKADRTVYNKQRDWLWLDLRDEFEVFICTTACLGTRFFQPTPNNPEIGTFPVDILFIDEASQPTMPEVWLAIEVCNPARLFLGGDDNQLQAFVESDLAKKIWNKSPLGLMNDLFNFTLLDIEYRMPWNLYAGTSRTFYSGKVGAHKSTNDNAKILAIRRKLSKIWLNPGDGKWLQLGNSFMIFNIVHGVSDRDTSHSSKNLQEALFLVDLAESLVQAGMDQKSVMGLTGYQGQFKQIHTLKRTKRSLGGMTVRKIDGVQGAEADNVLLSCVLDEKPGFMKSVHRANVATSRQKDVFFLIMKYRFWSNRGLNPTWSTYLHHMRQANAFDMHKVDIVGSWEFSVRPDSKEKPLVPQNPSDFMNFSSFRQFPTLGGIASRGPNPTPTSTTPPQWVPEREPQSANQVIIQKVYATWSNWSRKKQQMANDYLKALRHARNAGRRKDQAVQDVDALAVHVADEMDENARPVRVVLTVKERESVLELLKAELEEELRLRKEEGATGTGGETAVVDEAEVAGDQKVAGA